MSSANSPETPWLVGEVADKVASWIEKLGSIWVEGQITQISRRPGTRTAFITLRDPNLDKSLSVTCLPALLDTAEGPVEEGSRIIIFAKPTFYTGRGSFSLRAIELRTVGIGQLLANIELLRKQLALEGLFDLERKKSLPFLPKKIGLITGRASAAERDVVAVSQLRWPQVNFQIINTAVQGTQAVPQIIDALHELDALPDIEVIIIARGGGSVEDLLPFSDEKLCREVSQANTPIVSAIGHEPDHPLLDEVADLRAGTPTDAAKRVVPDIQAEIDLLNELHERGKNALKSWLNNNTQQLEVLLSRPILKNPLQNIAQLANELSQYTQTLNSSINSLVSLSIERVNTLSEKLNALGPAKTLTRGYAIVQANDKIVDSVEKINTNQQVRIRLQDGTFIATVKQFEKQQSTTMKGKD